MEEVQPPVPPPQTGPPIVLMHQWMKNNNVFHTAGNNPNILQYPPRVPLRLIRWPHVPPFMRPPIVNPAIYNQFPHHVLHRMMPLYPPNHPMALLKQVNTDETSSPLTEDHSPQIVYDNPDKPASPTRELAQMITLDANTPFVNESGDEIFFNASRENGDKEPIMQNEPTADNQEASHVDDSLLPDSEVFLEKGGSYSPNNKDSPSMNDIACEIEVETNTEAQQELLTEITDESQLDENDDPDKIPFSNIEEVLAAMNDSKSNPVHSLPFEVTGENSRLNIKMGPGVQEEVVKAAKSLFSKRTRTLYHWLYPDTSKTKLKATVTSAWDTLPENEKHFYMSQVLGRFGLQAGNLMINPQLDGIKCLSADTVSNEKVTPRKTNSTEPVEADQAVEDLFASCEDSDCWISYPTPQRKNERRKKRKSSGGSQALLSQTSGEDMDDDNTALIKRMRESSRCETDFEEDAELKNELVKFHLFSDSETLMSDDSDIWRRSPETKELFDQFGI